MQKTDTWIGIDRSAWEMRREQNTPVLHAHGREFISATLSRAVSGKLCISCHSRGGLESPPR